MARPLGAAQTRATDDLPRALGAVLTELRVRRGWSQQRLAETLGYDPTYVGMLERGTKSPTLRTLADLARLFDLRVSALLARAERRVARSTRLREDPEDRRSR